MILQFIHDNKGNTTGVFIPIEEWEALKAKYTELQKEEDDVELADWSKNIIKERLADYKQNPKQVEDFDDMIKNIKKRYMNYSFVNRPAVRIDITNAVNYYKKISPQLAHTFLERVNEAKKHIEQHPEGYQIRYQGVRIKMIEQFPYNIHYFIDDKEKCIVILAIIHAYKRPRNYFIR